ncbi:MAG: nitroreductase family protein, partial [Alphaproteobacteria bacterium]|nr:nitroreductase family protein [Alphaproteobacteria bacterium]
MTNQQFGQDFKPIPLQDYTTYPEEEMRQRARDFLALARKRHTVREFADTAVPRDIIETCILTAGAAPNGANHQPWHFAVIGDPERKKRIREEAEKEEQEFYAGRAGEEWLKALKPIGTDPNKPFLETAPWLIGIFGQRRSIGADGAEYKNYYVPESVSIATGFLIMALHNAGLATLTHTPAP